MGSVFELFSGLLFAFRLSSGGTVRGGRGKMPVVIREAMVARWRWASTLRRLSMAVSLMLVDEMIGYRPQIQPKNDFDFHGVHFYFQRKSESTCFGVRENFIWHSPQVQSLGAID